MFLLSVKITSSSILEMQKSEWPETLLKQWVREYRRKQSVEQ
jgi:hypothetical protein